MVLEGSLPCSQESYPEPNQSSTCVPFQIIRPSPRLVRHFIPYKLLWWVVSPPTNSQDGEPLCWLSTTAHSMYSQPSSISGGHLLHPQPQNEPCHGDRNPLDKEWFMTTIQKAFLLGICQLYQTHESSLSIYCRRRSLVDGWLLPPVVSYLTFAYCSTGSRL